VGFCLNHLMLKSVHLPQGRAELRRAVLEFWRVYAARVDWERAAAVEARVAALLPALMLARVDGKSPVEYLTAEGQAEVRAKALALLARPAEDLAALVARMEGA
jgi:hypothetical protein